MSHDSSEHYNDNGDGLAKRLARSRIFKVAGLIVWVLISFMAAQLIIELLLRGLVALGVPLVAMNDTVLLSIVSAVIYSLAIVIVIGVPWWAKRRKLLPEEVGLQRLPTWTDILMAPVGYVSYMLLSVLLLSIATAVLPGFNLEQEQNVGFANLAFQYEYLLAFVTLVIIAPVAEEVLFRGYLFGQLRRWLPMWGAIVLTSLLFGFVHGAWNVGIDTFALSVMLCVLRVTTGSLWAPILLHMTKNAIAFYLLFINPVLLGTLGG